MVLKHEDVARVIGFLRDVWWLGAVGFGVSLVATPIVRHIAYGRKIVDKPDDLLKPHGRPVAYLGGLAICAGLLTGLACYLTVMPNVCLQWQKLLDAVWNLQPNRLVVNPLWNLIGISLACVLITIVGLLDDLWNLKPRQKVYGQLAAAAILVLGGVGDRMALIILHPIMPGHWSAWVVLPISAAMCAGLVIATCNATNLLDGLDGLCGGVTAIISLGFLALAVWLAMWGRFPGTDELRIGLCLAMVGAVLGFLPYNIPPASIFMGDAGSMLLGFFVAVMMAMFCQEDNPRWFLAACVVYALPILDTGLAVVRRKIAGRPIFTGDRSHLYDQLVDRGMTVKQVVALFYALAVAAAALGVGVSIWLRLRYAIIVYAVMAAGICVTFYKLGMVTPSKNKTQGQGDHKA